MLKKKQKTAYESFIHEQAAARPKDVKIYEHFKLIALKWKQMSEEERKKYENKKIIKKVTFLLPNT